MNDERSMKPESQDLLLWVSSMSCSHYIREGISSECAETSIVGWLECPTLVVVEQLHNSTPHAPSLLGLPLTHHGHASQPFAESFKEIIKESLIYLVCMAFKNPIFSVEKCCSRVLK